MLLRIMKAKINEEKVDHPAPWDVPAVLREPAETAQLFDTKENKEFLNKLAFDMLETMEANNGVGLAAPQIGVSIRLITVNAGKKYVMFNPEIISEKGTQFSEEGCLSIPGIKVPITRPKMIKVKFYDHLFEEKTVKLRGLEAAVVAHEIDHLDGRLIIDYQ